MIGYIFVILMVMLPFALSLILHTEQMDEMLANVESPWGFRTYLYRGLLKPCLIAALVFLTPSLFFGFFALFAFVGFFVFAVAGCLLSWLMVGVWGYKKARRVRGAGAFR